MADIQLGENIKLQGFEMLDRPELVLTKKMVGIFVKRLNETKQGLSSFIVIREADEETKITAKALFADGEFIGEGAGKNLFIALGNAFNDLLSKLS